MNLIKQEIKWKINNGDKHSIRNKSKLLSRKKDVKILLCSL